MKSRQLLSVVLSLIMVFGVSAGSAFAQTDDELDDNSIDNDNIDDTTVEDEMDETIEDFEDCVEAGYPVMESYPEQCMTDDGTVFVNDEDDDDYDDDYDDDRYAKGDKFYVCHNGKETISSAESAVREHLSHGDSMRKCHDAVRDYDDDKYDDKDYDKDYRMSDKDMRHMMMRYCEMTDQEKRDFISEHDKAEDHVAKMNEYCSLDEDARNDYIKDHIDKYKDQMKDKMMDKDSRPHMDYDRLCELSETDRALKIDDPEKLDRISEWCDMTP